MTDLPSISVESAILSVLKKQDELYHDDLIICKHAELYSVIL